MPDILLIDRQRAALQELMGAAAARTGAEADVEAVFRAAKESAEAERKQAQEKLQEELSATQQAAVQEFQDATQAITARFEEVHTAAARELSAARLRVRGDFESDHDKIEADHKEAGWTTTTVYEADKKVAKDLLIERQRYVGSTLQQVAGHHGEALALLDAWGLHEAVAGLELSGRTPGAEDAFVALKQCAAAAEDGLTELRSLFIPKLLKNYRLVLLLLAVWLVLLAPALFMLRWYYWVAAVTAAVATIGLALHAWLRITLRTQALELYAGLRIADLTAQRLRDRCLEQAQADNHRQLAAARKRKTESLRLAEQEHERRIQEITERRDRDLTAAETKYQPVLDAATRQRDRDLRHVETKYQRLMDESNARYERDSQAVADKYSRRLNEVEAIYARDWHATATRWKRALARYAAVLDAVGQECRRLFPAWDDPAWEQWKPAAAVPAGLPFGELTIGPQDIPQAIPCDPRLQEVQPARLQTPALLGFPEHGSLLLKAEGDGRTEAVRLIQAVMLRSLSTVPPGKVRFTIIDPVGLGESFAAFTHLNDYDEALIGSRIWTETPHIEQRLADLTEHIENVIQKYLRNQFESLEEYNAQAGEVAEPYRFLVIANFPASFSVEAARRLASIVSSGARCGVQTLISVDMRLEPPQHFDPADLEAGATVLTWKDNRFHWQDDLFGRFPLRLEQPPSAEFCTALLQRVGEAAKAAGRVEVPFQTVAPPPEQWWKGDTRSGLRVPLGRAGAIKKQYLDLGHGTAQHALVAGKTGSGKSTLLHALITQLALTYSPDEVELYLVDFKKGVEFKTYATHELPHARVVAIESEREFGLSVLQRLDAELRRRGDRFRELGVHDLAAARQALGQPVPRVLLVVDEFQEFFVEDDKIAQEAALLLDRLVRQGRAFGIHVLLGSQTLGGAYSLARATIDQMAVRIALQCSEADGHLILSKDNSAARLLSRPGEAIYNDANGLVEGNDLFQVVWLSDETREEYLRKVQELAQARGVQAAPQVVFEGSAPGILEKNPLLVNMLEAPEPPAALSSWSAWLGEPIAIKEPTAAVFRRQSGANLLLVGQHTEAAVGILTGALVSLVAQLPPAEDGSRFCWLGDPVQDTPSADALFNRLPDVVPGLRVVAWRELANVMAELADEVDRRHKAGETEGPPRFLFVYGLQRFRDLRRQEDDFGFSRRGEDKPHPSKLFATILRDGPTVGIFTLLWCDTLTNLNRAFDRQALRELEMRVLFQMSAGDSSTLIDSPAASKLGLSRALYCTEEQGRVEKFRPYGLPSETWLAWVQERLRARGLGKPVSVS
jgi:S-DNA-T family DNA segregation ATPase FtsK/SpoIIIE